MTDLSVERILELVAESGGDVSAVDPLKLDALLDGAFAGARITADPTIVIDETREKVCFSVTWPPSLNRYYEPAGRGRKMISARGKAFREEVRWHVVAAGAYRSFRCERLALRITVRPPDRRVRDLDNLLKATQDALEKAGVFENDSQIDVLCMVRGPLQKGGGLQIELQSLEG